MSQHVLEEVDDKPVPSLSLVSDAKERSAILAVLARLYGMPRVASFPGGHPVAVTRGELPRIHAERCVVALKTDGVRYLLLLCVVAGAFRAVMVDRCLRMYEVVIYASEDYFTRETLLDGELVVDHRTNRLSYLVFDVVAMRGQHHHTADYRDRLQTIHNHILVTLPTGMEEDSVEAEEYIVEEDKIFASQCNHRTLSVLPKRFVNFQDGSRLWKQRHASPFPTDGLVLNCHHSPIVTGTLRTIFKWKPQNAVDVVVDPASRAVFCRRAGAEHHLERLHVDGRAYRVVLEQNRLVEWLQHRRGEGGGTTETSDPNGEGRWLVESTVGIVRDEVHLWPMKERTDKREANDVRVIEATLRIIADGVTLDELFALPSDCDPPMNEAIGGVRGHEATTPHGHGRGGKRHAAERPGVRTRSTRRRPGGE